MPAAAGGRWWCAAAIFTVLLSVFWIAGTLEHQGEGFPSWPAALFFCVILAYITPVFHYITSRTEQAFDDLAPHLDLDEEALATQRSHIACKPRRWVVGNTLLGVALWVFQSWMLAGGWSGMAHTMTLNATAVVMALGPLPVWVFMTCALYALTDNALLFRELSRHVEVDLLDTRALTPFGRMAVSSTLMVIGSQASFPIMWLGATTDPWTTIPGMIGTSTVLLFLFVAPVWPIHRAIRTAKQAELARLQNEINEVRRQRADADYAMLNPLLAFRREIAGTPDWPFDLGIMARFGLYLVVVPLTWIGAALIENLVDVFL